MEIQNTIEQFAVKVSGSMKNSYSEILTEDALQFVAKLQHNFNNTRLELLKNRQNRQNELDNGIKPDFLADTEGAV